MKHGMHVKNMKVQDLIRDLRPEDLMDKKKDGMTMMILRILLVMVRQRGQKNRVLGRLRIHLEVVRDGLRERRGVVMLVRKQAVGLRVVEEVCLMKTFKFGKWWVFRIVS